MVGIVTSAADELKALSKCLKIACLTQGSNLVIRRLKVGCSPILLARHIFAIFRTAARTRTENPPIKSRML